MTEPAIEPNPESAEPVQGIAVDRPGRPLPRRPHAGGASGATCAGGVESITFFTDEELAAAGVDPAPARRPAATSGPRALLDGRRAVRRRASSASRRARPSAWTRSTGSSWSAPGRPWRTPATTPSASAGRVGVFAGSGASSYLLHNLLPHRGAAGDGSAGCRSMLLNDRDFLPTRVSYKLNLQAAPAWWCRPPARPRWWRSTWPARACSRASATWRWPAASRSACRSAPATSTRRGASARRTATAAPSTPRPAGVGRGQRRAASWCSSAWPTRWPTATTSTP